MTTETLSFPTNLGKFRTKVTLLVVTLTSAALVFGKRAVAPHRASFKNLQQIPLTIAGFGFIDASAYSLGQGWGLLATGISLILLEHLIADEVA